MHSQFHLFFHILSLSHLFVVLTVLTFSIASNVLFFPESPHLCSGPMSSVSSSVNFTLCLWLYDSFPLPLSLCSLSLPVYRCRHALVLVWTHSYKTIMVYLSIYPASRIFNWWHVFVEKCMLFRRWFFLFAQFLTCPFEILNTIYIFVSVQVHLSCFPLTFSWFSLPEGLCALPSPFTGASGKQRAFFQAAPLFLLLYVLMLSLSLTANLPLFSDTLKLQRWYISSRLAVKLWWSRTCIFTPWRFL